MIERFSTVLVGTLILCLALIPSFIPRVVLPYVSVGSVEDQFKGGTILFVGDIMLGRHVETLTNEHGDRYPFRSVAPILQGPDITIGNFEGIAPKDHEQTPNESLKLSFPTTSVALLRREGFDALSLANNHAYDFGKEAYDYTRSLCGKTSMICAGNPYEVSTSSIQTFMIGDTKVGVLYVNGLSLKQNDPLLEKKLATLRRTSEIQLVYIHWGIEYKDTHSDEQQKLAHYLIENGVDAVIGSHPHVIEDIELYKGKPIFYSLGNFIFDQYFDERVEKGLGVRMYIDKKTITYTLIPFTSIDSPSQPRVMSIDKKDAFLKQLVITADDGDLPDLVGSHIIVQR